MNQTRLHISKFVSVDKYGRLIISGQVRYDKESMHVKIECLGVCKLSNDKGITLGIRFYGSCLESKAKYRI